MRDNQKNYKQVRSSYSRPICLQYLIHFFRETIPFNEDFLKQGWHFFVYLLKRFF
jgi:hypothetical protein